MVTIFVLYSNILIKVLTDPNSTIKKVKKGGGLYTLCLFYFKNENKNIKKGNIKGGGCFIVL